MAKIINKQRGPSNLIVEAVFLLRFVLVFELCSSFSSSYSWRPSLFTLAQNLQDCPSFILFLFRDFVQENPHSPGPYSFFCSLKSFFFTPSIWLEFPFQFSPLSSHHRTTKAVVVVRCFGSSFIFPNIWNFFLWITRCTKYEFKILVNFVNSTRRPEESRTSFLPFFLFFSFFFFLVSRQRLIFRSFILFCQNLIFFSALKLRRYFLSYRRRRETASKLRTGADAAVPAPTPPYRRYSTGAFIDAKFPCAFGRRRAV